MKYLQQFLLILCISFVGEFLKYVLPLPIPASIYGMVILFIGLLTGLIKLEQVKDVGKFLIEIMPVMFIPAGVGLMESWGTLKPFVLPVSVIISEFPVCRCNDQSSGICPWYVPEEKAEAGDF